MILATTVDDLPFSRREKVPREGRMRVRVSCDVWASPNPHPQPLSPTGTTFGSPMGEGSGAVYWQASQYSGFSSEQNTAAVACSCSATGAGFAAGAADTVVLAIFVAGRERR